MVTVKYRITFIEEALGTASANPELHKEFIASKNPNGSDAAEVAAIPTVAEEFQKALTVFSRDGDNPILWDYQIKGFFKDTCSALARGDGTLSAKLKAYKKVIDGTVFVTPRKIPLILPAKGTIGICTRPLRASTAQGERVALASSETVPEGTYFDIAVKLLSADTVPLLAEWMEYGELRGFGQWRNSGKGRFVAKELK